MKSNDYSIIARQNTVTKSFKKFQKTWNEIDLRIFQMIELLDK